MRTTLVIFGPELRSLDEKILLWHLLQLTIRAPKHHIPRILYREGCFFALTFSIFHRFHPNGLQKTRSRMQILWDISSRQKVQNIQNSKKSLLAWLILSCLVVQCAAGLAMMNFYSGQCSVPTPLFPRPGQLYHSVWFRWRVAMRCLKNEMTIKGVPDKWRIN